MYTRLSIASGIRDPADIMPSKPSSPGPSTAAKQTRSRKNTIPNQTEQARAGSAGGVLLPKETAAKASPPSTKKATATTNPGVEDASATEVKTPKRKPRKLNKDPTSNSTDTAKSSSTSNQASSEIASNSELEALKSRVKGLEAKVEELYRSGTILDSRAGRSPRRRGKGRKTSSTTQVPQIKTTNGEGTTEARVQELDDDDDDLDADEELVRLEGELEVARQDLEHYRPRARRSRSDGTDFVEEIPRAGSAATDRQVTLSGSYRIPIPASVNLQDVQTIKSGVSAAQNVARSFLEQRRASAAAAAAARAQSSTTPETASSSSSSHATPRASTTKVPVSKTRPKRSMSSNIEVAVDNSTGKQSWSDWIGGYSMAITRAVSKIEHEAAIEAQRSAVAAAGSARQSSAPTSRKAAGKRPAAKAALSGEQVHGLMS